MPEIFSKDSKVNVIEYGENCSSFPLWDQFKARVKALFTKK